MHRSNILLGLGPMTNIYAHDDDDDDDHDDEEDEDEFQSASSATSSEGSRSTLPTTAQPPKLHDFILTRLHHFAS